MLLMTGNAEHATLVNLENDLKVLNDFPNEHTLFPQLCFVLGNIRLYTCFIHLNILRSETLKQKRPLEITRSTINTHMLKFKSNPNQNIYVYYSAAFESGDLSVLVYLQNMWVSVFMPKKKKKDKSII